MAFKDQKDTMYLIKCLVQNTETALRMPVCQQENLGHMFLLQVLQSCIVGSQQHLHDRLVMTPFLKTSFTAD